MNLSGSLCVFLPTFLFFPQIGDRNGELTARMNVEQLMDALGVNESDLSPCSSEFEMQGDTESVFFLCVFKPSYRRYNMSVGC